VRPLSTTVNVYNPKGNGGDALTALFAVDLNQDMPTAVAGDFNLHHRQWSLYKDRNDSSGEELLEWAITNRLVLQNDTDNPTPTQRGTGDQRDSVIDLAFFNHAAIADAIFTDLEVINNIDAHLNSDHNALGWIVDTHGTEMVETHTDSYKLDKTKRDDWIGRFSDLVRAFSNAALDQPDHLDQEANHLVNAMGAATAAVMPPCQPRAPIQSPWWNKDCADALRLYQNALHHQKATLQGHFCTVVARAKREYCYG
jgi:hypothetical protein